MAQRKLRRKKPQDIKRKPKPPKRIIKKYKPQQCAHINSEGVQCKGRATGKGNLCAKHGGSRAKNENLVPAGEEHHAVMTNSKYDPQRHPVAYIGMSMSGLSDVEIAARFRVSVDTLKNWADTFEVFAEAYEIGKAGHEAWWINKGKDNLNDRSFNTGLFKFLTMNKLGFSDKVEKKSMNMSIHGVLEVPDPVSEDDWEYDDEEVVDVSP